MAYWFEHTHARRIGAEVVRLNGGETHDAEWVLGCLIPTYRHTESLPGIVAGLRARSLKVIVIDDGNDAETANVIARLHEPDQGVRVIRCKENGGKGAAMKTGFQAAKADEWTHAFQMDADGQHDLGRLDDFIALSRKWPEATICGIPEYDETVPRGRKIGRYVTHVWVWLETFSREITDSMCGFRIYPLADTLPVLNREWIGNRMDFDTEILVHLYWRGVDIREEPVKVVYVDGNVSNFRMLRDNVRISLMHTRLFIQAPIRVPIRWYRRAQRNRHRKQQPA